MSGPGLYDSLQMAYEFIEQADRLADTSEYDAAYLALDKAKTYAFNNEALLDDIQGRYDSLKKAQKQYVKGLETEGPPTSSTRNGLTGKKHVRSYRYCFSKTVRAIWRKACGPSYPSEKLPSENAVWLMNSSKNWTKSGNGRVN